ncbi:hypothetical protein LDO31_03050 [Luteimonas sp. XNQY3]|nr:hypothetical protein [Luteimonas sp. XNQY3]MCD9005225.1 hypothetical protein [Luteimonas sp. XNQY3]
MLSIRDASALARELGGVVKVHVATALKPLLTRVKDLEERDVGAEAAAAVSRHFDAHPVQHGRDADPAAIEAAVRAAVAEIPAPKDAEPVSDDQIASQVARYMEANRSREGNDADPAMIRKMVADAVAGIPPPKDGRDADQVSASDIDLAIQRHLTSHPIRDGKDADEVDLGALADLVISKLLASDRLSTLADLAAAKAVSEHFEVHPVQHGRDADPEQIRTTVAEAVAAIPPPKDGRDADPVSDAQIAAQVARYVELHPPRNGADGVGLAGAMIDRTGALIVTTTRGEAINLGRVVGEDGKDGLAFDTASGEYDADRGFVIRLAAGDRSSEFVLPYMVHRGFWREGMGTKAAQSVTHDGALWIAKRANASKPCLENADDWILAARKGRDGKDGKSVKVASGPVSLEPGRG